MASFLPQTVEYAIRVMAHIASHPTGTALRTKDMTGPTNIPPHYLSKILRSMVLAGLLESQRGHHGGFILAKRPDEIPLEDIMSAVSFRLETEKCAFGIGKCNPDNPCMLHDSWMKLNRCVDDWARNTTLANASVTLSALRFKFESVEDEAAKL
ncbi:MAG: Rrf2 family transcriptional regulator [Deltaproteobacteria bacterium]|nr:Rrf2 family transcriptional regulator [bacterium]MCB9476718.1 Rrf2 family transcriptional regulator [Deltaproteobacteria bacterium]MCB9480117.1 Rrf2 family transcriptional regulator [Deltaproteobacteria bacterium]MCB9488901.1 Rrf2 family transcriptional regulator [Deltaproteobacteria bacterium]